MNVSLTDLKMQLIVVYNYFLGSRIPVLFICGLLSRTVSIQITI